ncbi:MAG: hypothetical protein GX052_09790 [Syntrophomonadaceae bacterium]|jgi:hypothetical protein|nr:hypothetical protein [Syntrophomonadaceae bacterium]
MSSLQKLFLLLALGYLLVKLVFALLLYAATKRVEEKGREFHRKRNALKDKTV